MGRIRHEIWGCARLLLYSYYQINYPDWKIIHLIYAYISETLIVKPDSKFCVSLYIWNFMKILNLYICLSRYNKTILIMFVVSYNFSKDDFSCFNSCCIMSINIKVQYKLALGINLKSVAYSAGWLYIFCKINLFVILLTS